MITNESTPHSSHIPIAYRLCASLHPPSFPRFPEHSSSAQKNKLIGTPQRPTNEKITKWQPDLFPHRIRPTKNRSSLNQGQKVKRGKKKEKKITVFRALR